MAKALQDPPAPAPAPAPAFIRQLARLGGVDVPASVHSLPEGLGEWIDWNRAVVLARALDGRPPAAADEAPAHDGGDECAQVRESLAAAIVAACEAAAAGPAEPRRGAAAGSDREGYAVFHQACLTLQRSMQAATGRLRGQLRDRLACKSPELARLAELDAVMEQLLSPREQTLMARVPVLLGERFENLRRAAAAARAGTDAAEAAMPESGTWRQTFRREMQDALLAELEVRFHPIEGLLAALHTE